MAISARVGNFGKFWYKNQFFGYTSLRSCYEFSTLFRFTDANGSCNLIHEYNEAIKNAIISIIDYIFTLFK